VRQTRELRLWLCWHETNGNARDVKERQDRSKIVNNCTTLAYCGSSSCWAQTG
jgi:hypothetical protein